MKRYLVSVGMLGVCLAVLSGCGSGGSAPSETVTTEGGEKLTTSKELEAMVFAGGYGSDFYEQAAKEYEEKTGVKVTVVGDPHIDEQLKPRFTEGNPPGLAFPGVHFDHWGLVAEDEVMPLDSALAGQDWDKKWAWGQTFEPSLLRLGKMDGKQYVLPFYFSVLGWWYDPDLFKENGWEPPKTYAELLALCQKIQAKGIAPITYQGQYPDYMIAGMLIPWVISGGGMDQYNKMQNLEPGAWNSDALVGAAKKIADLRAQDYFQKGATAMSHTDAQVEFIERRAAMIPCGTWLHAEMESKLAKGRKMAFMLPPTLVDGKGDPTNIMIKIEPWLVPAKSKNQEHAIGFFKYMTSLEKAKQFVKEKGTLMAIRGSDQVELPDYLAGAAKSFSASKAVWAQQWKDWYPKFYEKVEQNVTKLLNGDLTPEQFGVECEAAAEATRKDSSVAKHKVE